MLFFINWTDYLLSIFACNHVKQEEYFYKHTNFYINYNLKLEELLGEKHICHLFFEKKDRIALFEFNLGSI